MAQAAQGRARAMITGLRGTSIWSEDVNNLLPFYRDILGLEVTTETPGFVVLGGSGWARTTKCTVAMPTPPGT